ncbi:hypothetical protein CR203_15045 [Salipaludibacillus neizhouensis]|uniref:Uncharacterized protein n=1 Tax=Salipaludibacillus neizhouensis TaxID=885475 RepID=A0A3A9K6W0_9BACI|nr:hypothetical protein [Salipaludibacillus neizhouensis]RKL66600.1 hypothetical protein CR203_15045 [Salipaludibacillus neizhouensis]
MHPFIGGFVKKNMHGNIFNQTRCTIYSCSVTSDQLQRMEYFIKEIEAKKHLYRYNLLGLFALILNKRMNRKYSFFCSQFVATVLQECEIANFKKPPSLIRSNELIEGANFQLLYQGNLEKICRGIDVKTNVDMACMNI